MLFFSCKDIVVANLNVAVNFNHIGSLFSITLKNSSSQSLDLDQAKLIGMDTDVKWAFNTGKGAEKFDLYKEEFPNSSFAGNYLSFKASTSSLAAGESTVFWGWYPPLPNPSNSEWERWPELKFELVDANNIQTTTINSKPKRTSATVAGKSYCFYAVWDGTNLGFTDNAHAL